MIFQLKKQTNKQTNHREDIKITSFVDSFTTNSLIDAFFDIQAVTGEQPMSETIIVEGHFTFCIFGKDIIIFILLFFDAIFYFIFILVIFYLFFCIYYSEIFYWKIFANQIYFYICQTIFHERLEKIQNMDNIKLWPILKAMINLFVR